MKYVYRMMSQQEYNDLIAGKTLTNTTVHAAAHKFSDSVGFCFLPWEVEGAWFGKRTIKMTALQAVDRLLPDKRKYDVWVQLKVLNPQVLAQSRGKYRDVMTEKQGWITEYCTTSYSIEDLYPMHAFSMPKVLDMLFDRFIAGADD